MKLQRVKKIVFLLCLAWLSASSFAHAYDAKETEKKRVLAIFFFREGVPWQNLMAESLRKNLVSKSPYPIELNIEYTDLERYNDETYRQKLIELYRHKYSHPQMDLVIGVGDEAVNFLIKDSEEMFGKVPLVLVSANPKTLQRDFLKPYMTSLVWGADIQGNVELIEELLPKTRHLYIISGSSLTDREAEKLARTALQKYKGPFKINYMSNISKEDLLEKVAQVPKNTALLYLVFSQDTTGTTFVPYKIMTAISKKANAPVFGVLDSYLGHGIVGGSLLSAEVQGRRCAEIAGRILKGESPVDIYPAQVLNNLMFDWRELKRWEINEDRLPPGSIVQFKTPAFWEHYRRYLIASIVLVVFGYGFISLLLVQRKRLRQQFRFEQMLSNLSASFVNLPPEQVNSVIERELELSARSLEVDRASVFELSADTQSLIAAHSYTNTDVERVPAQIDLSQLTWGRQKILNGEMVMFSLPAELPAEAGAEKDYFHSQGVQSAVMIPLAAGQKTLGLLTMAMLRRRRRWSRNLPRQFGLVAEVFANALARKQSDEDLVQSKNFNRSVLDSLKYHIAVLDREGNILDVNENWIQFARENDAKSLDRIGVGNNYLEVCRRSSESGDQTAREALEGIQAVLQGTRNLFELEYRCDSAAEKRWFWMRVIPFSGTEGGVVISHIDNSERKLAGLALQDAYTKVKHLKNQLEAESTCLQEEIKLEHDFDNIIGNSAAIQYVLFKVQQVAGTDTAVLILGETGTGKELVARDVHHYSLRNERALVKVNCATLPENLIESELFGHERGAFTGAQNRRLGRFEVADGASVFLDEIGELPLALQTKLLGVLQDGKFERLGSSQRIKVDVRVIAATNRNLEEEVRKGRFREDLFYRLNVFPITVPPLRDRVEDIPLLTRYFVEKTSKRLGKSFEEIPASVMQTLQDYPWPGNVRELENVIERAVIVSSGPTLRLADELKQPQLVLPSSLRTMEEVEFDHIVRVLEQTNWKVSGKGGAAEILGLKRSTLRARIQKLGIRKP